MGTSIRVEMIRGEETPVELWEQLTKEFLSEYSEAETCEDALDSGIIYCPYSCANIESINIDLEKYGGSDITINLFYLERDPDETKKLWDLFVERRSYAEQFEEGG